MNNEDFKNEVYRKYSYYKNIKNDEFFNKHQYKKNNLSFYINKVASIIIVCSFITGIAYATNYYINNIWKEPEKYNYYDEKEITKVDTQEAISETDAKNMCIKLLKKMNIDIGNITECVLTKEPTTNSLIWTLTTDDELEIKINATTGNFISYTNKKLLSTEHSYNLDEVSAINVSKELVKTLNYKENYKFSYISKIDMGQWQADFCISYNEIMNKYQCIRITFFAETKQIIMINLFNENFENNEYIITEDEAIELVKNQVESETIKSIIARKDIEKMNAIIYQKDNPVDKNYEYRTDAIVRNIWNVKITYNLNNYEETYFVDGTTGEIIGGDQIK